MITDADAEFHPPDDGDPTWGETNFFGFYAADVPLNVGVYTLFRPNLGVVGSTICMNSGDAPQPWRADFCDMESHLAIPEPRSLASYALANGLTVTTLVPNDRWHLGYDDRDGTSIDVTYQALMPAFDIHDPEMDPISAAQQREAQADGAAGGFAWGTAYNGHFDQTGHYSGEVVLRGRSIPIDCTSTMDHSWGPRAERGGPNMSWLHAHFSDDYAVHAIWSFDETKGRRSGHHRARRRLLRPDGRVRGDRRGRGHPSPDRAGPDPVPLAGLAQHGRLQRAGPMAERPERRGTDRLRGDPGLRRPHPADPGPGPGLGAGRRLSHGHTDGRVRHGRDARADPGGVLGRVPGHGPQVRAADPQRRGVLRAVPGQLLRGPEGAVPRPGGGDRGPRALPPGAAGPVRAAVRAGHAGRGQDAGRPVSAGGDVVQRDDRDPAHPRGRGAGRLLRARFLRRGGREQGSAPAADPGRAVLRQRPALLAQLRRRRRRRTGPGRCGRRGADHRNRGRRPA